MARQSKRCFLAVLTLCLGVWSFQAAATEIIVNGTFDVDLSGWITFADLPPFVAYWDNGVAAIPENPFYIEDPADLLQQNFLLPAGTYSVELDFLNLIASSEAFTARIDSSLLFGLDQSGANNVSGAIGPSSIGGDWEHFSGLYVNPSDSSEFIAFVLRDYDGDDQHSEVRLDNVSLMPVPEPATMALMGLGLCGLVARFHRKRA